MNKYIFYRVTSRVNDKPRLNGFSKFDCLENLLQTFPDFQFICLADNCDEFTIERLKKKEFTKLVTTSLGNSRSFLYLLDREIPLIDDNDIVYFVEDDYLHKLGSDRLIVEGLKYFHYVSLYDHPDKYSSNWPNTNPLVDRAEFSEHTQVVKGGESLWRTSGSTTMTFGCYARTIKADLNVWKFFSSGSETPRDFHTWTYLTSPRGNLFKLPKTVLISRLL